MIIDELLTAKLNVDLLMHLIRQKFPTMQVKVTVLCTRIVMRSRASG